MPQPKSKPVVKSESDEGEGTAKTNNEDDPKDSVEDSQDPSNEENDDDEDSEEEDSEMDAASEEEILTEAEKQPAGDHVQRIEPPKTIKNVYIFRDLLHDPGDGRRVYMCDETSGNVKMTASELRAKRRREEEAHRKEQGLSDRCIVKVWQKAARPPSVSEEWLNIQLRLLRMERHPNVLLPRRIWEDDVAYYVQFDIILVGTTLLQSILNDSTTTEYNAKQVTKGILRGLGHLHSHNFSHRDLKPENIMLEWKCFADSLVKHAAPPRGWVSSKNGVKQWRPAARFKNIWRRHALKAYVRIVDLDTVSEDDSEIISGTPGYMAPDAFIRNPGREGDLFAIGVMLFMLIACESPFHDVVHKELAGDHLADVAQERREQISSVMETRIQGIDWSISPWCSLPIVRDFVRLLLHTNPKARGMDAKNVLAVSPWFHAAVEVTDEISAALANLHVAQDLDEFGDDEMTGNLLGSMSLSDQRGTERREGLQMRSKSVASFSEDRQPSHGTPLSRTRTTSKITASTSD